MKQTDPNCKPPLVILFAALVLVFQSCGGMAQDGAMMRAYKSFEKGECDKVLIRLSEAERLTAPTPELKAEILFLRARCLEIQQETSDAKGLYKYIISTFPQSQSAFKAKERLKMLE